MRKDITEEATVVSFEIFCPVIKSRVVVPAKNMFWVRANQKEKDGLLGFNCVCGFDHLINFAGIDRENEIKFKKGGE